MIGANEQAHALAVAIDKEQRIAALIAKLQRKRQASIDQLENRRAQAGRVVATDDAEHSSEFSALRSQIRDLENDVDAYERAIAELSAEHVTACNARAAIQLDEAKAASTAAHRREAAALAAIDAAVRRLGGELQGLVAAHSQALATANQASLKVHRLEGTRPDLSNAPFERLWSAYPDLRDIVDELLKYAAGRTRLQAMRADSITLAESLRRTRGTC